MVRCWGQGDRQAARGGEGLLGAADADKARQARGDRRAAFEGQAEAVIVTAAFLEPAQHLGALAGLRGDEDRLFCRRQRRDQLFRQRQGDGIDAESAVVRLDGAADGMRAAHAEKDEAAGLAQRRGDFSRHLAGGLERGFGVACLPLHFRFDGQKACRLCHGLGHPFTPPLVRPDTTARCITRPMITGGKAARMPAVAIMP